MNKTLKNILAVVAGIIGGMIVNMGIIQVSGMIIPPPEGADITSSEGLRASMDLFGPKHFIFPFLAHALGTFAGALIAGLIAANNKMWFALGIGCFFLLGGISSVFLLPSPLWYTLLDLIIAYIPFALLAGAIAQRRIPKVPETSEQ